MCKQGRLYVEQLGRGFAWLDAGTTTRCSRRPSSSACCSRRQGQLIASPEEIAYRQNWIDRRNFEEVATKLSKTKYGRMLLAQLQSHDL